MKAKLSLKFLAHFFVALTFVAGACTLAAAQYQETILHDFNGGSPNQPGAGLISDAQGNLYGETGVYGVGCDTNCGTAFELSPTDSGWKYTGLHVFVGGADGVAPQGGLTMDAEGNLYGTTAQGGGTCTFQSGGCGTVFKLTRNSNGTWSETVLHRFTRSTDGALPFSGVIFDASGSLYGTTDFGGANTGACPQGCGTIFKLTPNGATWTFSVIHNFTAGSDGAFGGGLVFDATGNLYGVSAGGGTVNNHCGGDGCGTVFKMAPNGSGWTKTTLYIFSGESDGATPISLVIDAAGNLYGVSLYAGHGNNTDCSPNGCGTVFELSPQGNEYSFTLLHAFIGSDGANPSGVVLDSSGNVFGASERYGSSCCGTIFELMPTGSGSWNFTTLFNFTGKTDGNYPPGPPVVDASGNLYGVTSNGGAANSGVAWELTP
ncbi:MAG TPA: choice-of-anchor tandem repeat GloVer-containing protein [Candidatus Sulfotelmatobacter sp.]|nr:choice-of-anchor tandem repeat GloVer-containing protein [Candidatus Sulfotelmatobacter sp.]